MWGLGGTLSFQGVLASFCFIRDIGFVIVIIGGGCRGVDPRVFGFGDGVGIVAFKLDIWFLFCYDIGLI